MSLLGPFRTVADCALADALAVRVATVEGVCVASESTGEDGGWLGIELDGEFCEVSWLRKRGREGVDGAELLEVARFF